MFFYRQEASRRFGGWVCSRQVPQSPSQLHKELHKNKMKTVNLVAAIWMDLEGLKLNEIIQTERQILYDITYMWNLKNTTSE